MSAIQLVFLVLVFVVVVAGVLGVTALMRPDVARRRLRVLVAEGTDPVQAAGRWMRWLAAVTAPIRKKSRSQGGFEKSGLKLRFAQAGIRKVTAEVVFYGVTAGLTLGLPLIGLALLAVLHWPWHGGRILFGLLLLAALGYGAPGIVLSRLVRTRQREIFEALPDVLDLMTVCIEAGLGTEAAMLRVADDMRLTNPAIAEEMQWVHLELRAGAGREWALRNMALRTGVEELDEFATMVSQAERFGTGIAASLRIHSAMLRTRRRQRAEEAAAKIPLKLLFPLIFCIFPALMVVLLGPAAIQIYREFSSGVSNTGGT